VRRSVAGRLTEPNGEVEQEAPGNLERLDHAPERARRHDAFAVWRPVFERNAGNAVQLVHGALQRDAKPFPDKTGICLLQGESGRRACLPHPKGRSVPGGPVRHRRRLRPSSERRRRSNKPHSMVVCRTGRPVSHTVFTFTDRYGARHKQIACFYQKRCSLYTSLLRYAKSMARHPSASNFCSVRNEVGQKGAYENDHE